MLSHFSCVWLFVTPWTVALQAPQSMGFSRQEYWSGWSCPSLGDLPNPGIEPSFLLSPALAGGFFITSTTYFLSIWEKQLLSMTELGLAWVSFLFPVPSFVPPLSSSLFNQLNLSTIKCTLSNQFKEFWQLFIAIESSSQSRYRISSPVLRPFAINSVSQTQNQATTDLLFIMTNFTYSRISYQWGQAMCTLLSLTSFTLVVVQS